MNCPSCGHMSEPGAAFCSSCGAVLDDGVAPSVERAQGLDWNALGNEARAGARRFWPVLSLISYAGYFDWRMNGNIIVTLLLGLLAAAPFVFWRRVQPYFADLQRVLPSRFLWPLLAGIPSALLYFTRWSGTQSDAWALITALAIGGFGFLIATYRQQINEALTPLYEQRNRVLPRPARFVLMFLLPILFTFLIAHRNLGDITALLGAATNSRRTPTGASSGVLILLTVLLSAATSFLLLNEPGRREQRP